EWWKLLRAVIKLLKPICDFTHKLEADYPYPSQLLPIWHTLLKGAEEWVQGAEELTLERAKMLIYIKANAGLGARHNTEAQLLARMGE
ncbi:hypothetical protein HaLaN_10097, partial [Haematococcus lacustris]